MSTSAANIDKSLELVQKTYHLQNPPNIIENSSQNRPSTVKNSHQPSRKTSVHDVQEATREEFNKVISEIHEGLARLNALLETMSSAAAVRDEFGRVKLQLIVKITDIIVKLTKNPTKKSESNVKMTYTYNPQHLVYCLDHFRSELFKAQYLFASLTLAASIGSSTLENIVVKSLSSLNLQQTSTDLVDGQFNEDVIDIQRDLCNLEEHLHLLNQCYSNQISDWQTIEDFTGRTPMTTMTTSATMTTIGGKEKLPLSNTGLTNQRLALAPVTQKLSTTSSTTSIEHSSFCARLYQKCQMVCCICTPNYL